MSAMHHDHLKTAQFRQLCILVICLHDIPDLLFCQCFYRNAIRTGSLTRTILDHSIFFVFIQEISSCILTGMGKLYAGYSSMPFDRIRCISKAGYRAYRLCIQMIGMRSICGRMNHQLTDGYDCCPAFRSQFIKRCGLGANGTFRRDLSSAHRRGKHSVSESDITDLYRFTKIFKFAFHTISQLLF